MKMKLILALIFIAFMGHSIQAQSVILETSKVTFKIGNMGVRTVEGSIIGMKGSINFDAKNLKASSFNVTVDPATIDTKDKKRDDHLRTADFFDVKKYKEIKFQSESFSKSKTGYVVKGKMTMHGVTKTVSIPFTFDGKTFKGSIKMKRLDYKIGEDTNTFMITDELEATIICNVK